MRARYIAIFRALLLRKYIVKFLKVQSGTVCGCSMRYIIKCTNVKGTISDIQKSRYHSTVL